MVRGQKIYFYSFLDPILVSDIVLISAKNKKRVITYKL